MSFSTDLDSPILDSYSPENSKDTADADAKPSSPIAPPLSPTTSTPEQYSEADTSSPLSSETSCESVKNQPSPVPDQSLSPEFAAEYQARASTFTQKLDNYFLSYEPPLISAKLGFKRTYEVEAPFDYFWKAKRPCPSVPECQEPPAKKAKASPDQYTQGQHHAFDGGK